MSKLGFVLGFQSGPGAGGREGLQPSSMWFRYAKLYTLAAKRVAAEFGIATVWTWGWGTFNAAGADPDKQAAACVYLWTRDPIALRRPGRRGHGLRGLADRGPDRTLPQGVQCSLDGRALRQTDLSRMTAVTHDRDVALHDPLRPARRDRAREGLGRPRDAGDPGDRRRRLRAAAGPRTTPRSRRRGANTFVARAAVADELLRAQIEGSLTGARADRGARSGSSTRAYPDVLIRPFKVAAGGAVARQPDAPASRSRVGRAGRRSSGCPRRSPRRSRPASAPTRSPRLDEALPLGAVPYVDARAGIRDRARVVRADAGVRGRLPASAPSRPSTGRSACATTCRTRRSSRLRPTCRSWRSAPSL